MCLNYEYALINTLYAIYQKYNSCVHSAYTSYTFAYT